MAEPSNASPIAAAPGPIEQHQRVETLDVLRGLAIFGIFVVNIPFFAWTLTDAMDASMLTGMERPDRMLHAAAKMLFEHKFIGLFALLFGVGMGVQWTRAEARGGSFTAVQRRRLAILVIIGLAHGVLLWYGDILFIYGVVGLIALMMIGLSYRAQIMLGIGGILIGTLFAAMIARLTVVISAYEPSYEEYGADAETTETSQDHDAEGGEDDDGPWVLWQAALSASKGDPAHPKWPTVEHIAYNEGPMSITIMTRAIQFAMMLFFGGVFNGIGLRVLGMFLIGAAMWKTGFFRAERVRWQRRACMLGLGVGLPLQTAAVAMVWSDAGRQSWWLFGGDLLLYLTSPALTFGYIGAVCLLVHSGAARGARTALAAVGRMALTNYLLQSLIAATIFYWWGLGWFGDVRYTTLLGLVLVIFAGQIALSMMWLRAFRFGPIEWLWRTLTYGRLQPMITARSSSS